ncbi:hypothetical protein [Cutibacterium granulosum]|uniref:Uncharacterized protein n=1 Tax=Cutibacterium granulosum DSM 20700 TaxID=1160719 RepID=U1GLR4_9ACTN|nr:hypothetical protein H641_02508 [Cutibacterium granulosum DSM 20700]
MSNRRVSLPGASELFRSTAKHNSFGDADKAHDGLDDVEQRTSSYPDASARSGNGTRQGHGGRQTAAADALADAQGSTEDSRAATTNSSATRGTTGSRRGSGRVRHDEKITVYVSTEELLALENARLQLRAQGVAADRGRIVREAIAIALADLDLRGTESALVTRLDQ